MSVASTPCTRPPGRWPSAATPCSRPPSRRCAGSACAPGGSARSPPPRSSCSTTSTAARHDQQGHDAPTENGSLAVPAVLTALLLAYGLVRSFAGWPTDHYQGWTLLGILLLSVLPVLLLLLEAIVSSGG